MLTGLHREQSKVGLVGGSQCNNSNSREAEKHWRSACHRRQHFDDLSGWPGKSEECWRTGELSYCARQAAAKKMGLDLAAARQQRSLTMGTRQSQQTVHYPCCQDSICACKGLCGCHLAKYASPALPRTNLHRGRYVCKSHHKILPKSWKTLQACLLALHIFELLLESC